MLDSFYMKSVYAAKQASKSRTAALNRKCKGREF